jgi:hypothetical protein
LVEQLAAGAATPQELADALGLSQQNVSKHLQILHRSGARNASSGCAATPGRAHRVRTRGAPRAWRPARAARSRFGHWTGSNQPVILVCSRPKTGEAYWRLELTRLYGQQAEGFTFTLPLARGLK